MDVDAITVEVITKALRAWQQGNKPPADLLALDLLSDPVTGAAEGRDLRLRDLILNMTVEELARARQAEAVAELARRVAFLNERDGCARAATLRDEIGGGRKVAIHILEFFDRIGYTRRARDTHILRGSPEQFGS